MDIMPTLFPVPPAPPPPHDPEDDGRPDYDRSAFVHIDDEAQSCLLLDGEDD